MASDLIPAYVLHIMKAGNRRELGNITYFKTDSTGRKEINRAGSQ
jgi:hypothetical protein